MGLAGREYKRRNKEENYQQENKERMTKEPVTQVTANHEKRNIKRYIEIEKDKSREAKSSWDKIS